MSRESCHQHCNPFMLDKLTVLNNHEKAKFDDGVFEDIKIIEAVGENQFLHFWEKRLVSAVLSLNHTISLNSYYLPGNYDKKSVDDHVMTAVMMTKLVEAGKSWRYLVEDILNIEWFGIAQSMANDQFSLYHGTKSSVVEGLLHTNDSQEIQSETSGCVIELSMLFR